MPPVRTPTRRRESDMRHGPDLPPPFHPIRFSRGANAYHAAPRSHGV